MSEHCIINRSKLQDRLFRMEICGKVVFISMRNDLAFSVIKNLDFVSLRQTRAPFSMRYDSYWAYFIHNVPWQLSNTQ